VRNHSGFEPELVCLMTTNQQRLQRKGRRPHTTVDAIASHHGPRIPPASLLADSPWAQPLATWTTVTRKPKRDGAKTPATMALPPAPAPALRVPQQTPNVAPTASPTTGPVLRVPPQTPRPPPVARGPTEPSQTPCRPIVSARLLDTPTITASRSGTTAATVAPHASNEKHSKPPSQP
jgi:hypothetical protein